MSAICGLCPGVNNRESCLQNCLHGLCPIGCDLRRGSLVPIGARNDTVAIYFGWFKPDTLAMMIADLEEATENPSPCAYLDVPIEHRAAWDATAQLLSLVGDERANEMIDGAKGR